MMGLGDFAGAVAFQGALNTPCGSRYWTSIPDLMLGARDSLDMEGIHGVVVAL